MSKLTKLTDAQRDFAEKNHDLVYRYLRMKGLSVDDFYDIVIFGYLRAVQVYDENTEVQDCSFKTVAYRRMFATLWNHFRDMRRQKRDAVVLSLDIPMMGNIGLPDYAADASAVYEYAEARETWAAVRANATPKQLQTLDMRAQGYTNREIGKVYHLSPSSVSGRICRLRKNTMRLAA